MTRTAVHFGAGNIGRGFVGLLLHEAGYRVIFADVAAPLIEALQAADSYRVVEVGPGAREHEVTGVDAINSAADPEALTAAIAAASVVTTAVGPKVLPLVAPAIAAGIAARAEGAEPLVVMACENAIGATDTLRAAILEHLPSAAERAVFANTAVDRIVPAQPEGAGLDVTVEAYHEWVIDTSTLVAADGARVPLEIPGAEFVENLEPYIERKLFTVNTGHATVAYHGQRAGASTIAEAVAIPEVAAELRAVLAETSALLVAKHELDPAAQAAYAEKIATRFTNPHLPDTVVRVGREPLRKLSRHERFIGPAAEIAERGTEPVALLRAVGAALHFSSPEDAEAVELARRLSELSAAQFAAEVCGIEGGHRLFDPLVGTIAAAKG
ncbi:MAG: mannitol-1-phosphate 5-dehydrogenase [Austwickia sp.]|nr:mannitol-1-phosphate 5-dehydrogenase [Austwickia sp.]